MRELEREDGVRYLLGELTEAEAERFEDELFGSTDRVEAMRAIEAELYEDYVVGLLEGGRRAAFEARCLGDAGGRARLRDAALFERAFGPNARPVHMTEPARVIPLFGRRVVQVVAAIAAVVVAVLGASLMGSRDESLTLRLAPMVRSAGAPQTIARASDGKLVLELAVDDAPGSGPFAVETTHDGRPFDVRATSKPTGKSGVTLHFERSDLTPGRYELTLRTKSGEELERYTFRVE